MIFTPGQLHNRAEFYYQLAQLIAAGITLPQALEHLAERPPSRAFKRPLRELVEELRTGCSFADALQTVRGWLPELDIAILQAGEESGRLDTSLRVLSDIYRTRAQTARQFLSDMLYPGFLLHFAIFILPFPNLFVTGDVWAYLYRTVGVLVPFYFVAGLIVFAMQGQRGEIWRGVVERVLHIVPVLGKARRSLALSRLSIALESLLNAGVNVVQAWELAAESSGSPALRRVVRRWRTPLDEGSTPAELVSRSRYFPDLFAGQYSSGEVSGKLDEMLRRLHDYYEDDGVRRMRALSQWMPRFFYLLIALYIGFRVITFWQGYFNQLQSIGDF